ncbi:MFS transporter [Aspergillus floccosus]
MAGTRDFTLELGDEQEHLNLERVHDTDPCKNKLAIYVAYLGAILASSDESTVVAVYEIIASHFETELRGVWLLVAFNLGFCASLPVYGALSNTCGCKRVLLDNLRSSAVSGSMKWLVAGRVVTGIGAAGLEVIISFLIKDMVPPKDVALMRSYTNIVKTTGRGIGAPLGSLVTQTVGWRWSFAGRLPLIIGCALLAKLYTPDSNNHEDKESNISIKWKAVDYPGIVTFSLTMTMLILGLNMEGNSFLQSGCLIGAAICAALLVWVELFIADSPVVPLHLIRLVGSFWVVQLLAFCARDGIRSVIVPYMTRVHGINDAPASLFIGVMSIGLSSGAVISGLYIKWFKEWFTIGFVAHIMNITASLVLYIAWARDTTPWASLIIFPISMATGITTSTQFVGMTTLAPESASASIISVYYLCQQMGIILGSSSASSVIWNRFTSSMLDKMNSDSQIKEQMIYYVISDPKYVSGLPASTQEIIRLCLNDGYKFAPLLALICFLLVTPFVIIGRHGKLY